MTSWKRRHRGGGRLYKTASVRRGSVPCPSHRHVYPLLQLPLGLCGDLCGAAGPRLVYDNSTLFSSNINHFYR
ncbi:unnamed protein product [Nezara viridula]|uniref:Uncharacterized protein n=1 Tax=Nezara viridula TaxID=85310 RepID=A0A9P0HSH8_NEZVI|nr:unnamed protein product [Nezara viridula]